MQRASYIKTTLIALCVGGCLPIPYERSASDSYWAYNEGVQNHSEFEDVIEQALEKIANEIGADVTYQYIPVRMQRYKSFFLWHKCGRLSFSYFGLGDYFSEYSITVRQARFGLPGLEQCYDEFHESAISGLETVPNLVILPKDAAQD